MISYQILLIRELLIQIIPIDALPRPIVKTEN